MGSMEMYGNGGRRLSLQSTHPIFTTSSTFDVGRSATMSTIYQPQLDEDISPEDDGRSRNYRRMLVVTLFSLTAAAVVGLLFTTMVLCLAFNGVTASVLLIVLNGGLMVWLELNMTEKLEPVGGSATLRAALAVLIALWLVTTVAMFVSGLVKFINQRNS